MPPQTTQSYDQTPLKDSGNLDSDKSRRLDEIRFIESQIDEAYMPQTEVAPEERGDMTPLGVAATQHQPENAADHAVSYEIVELTLEELGRNIEIMRADATGKTVNSALTDDEFKPRATALIPTPNSIKRPVNQANLNIGYRMNQENGNFEYPKAA